MDDDDGIFYLGLAIGVLIGLIFFVCLSIIFDDTYKKVEQLGQSICEEKYGKDYDSYDSSTKTLHCKDVLEVEDYYGIIVAIGGDNGD